MRTATARSVFTAEEEESEHPQHKPEPAAKTQLASSPSLPHSFRSGAIEPKTPLSSVQPFGDYVARVFHVKENNSSLYDLITCCATLYLFRCDPATLQRLARLWSLHSAGKHQTKVRSVTSCAGGACSNGGNSGSGTTPPLVTAAGDDAGGNPPMDLCSSPLVAHDVSEDERAAHFLSMLQHCVTEYFNNNWTHIRRTIAINKEYKNYIVDVVLVEVLRMVDANEPFTRERRSGSTAPSPLPEGAELPGTNSQQEQDLSERDADDPPIAISEEASFVPSETLVECSDAGRAAGFQEDLEAVEEACQAQQAAPGIYRVPQRLHWIAEDSLQQLRADCRAHGIVLFFHALFSEPSATTLCSLVRAYNDINADPECARNGVARLAVVNCASQVDLFKQYNVQWYPCIVYVPPVPETISDMDAKLCITASNDDHVMYPEDGVRHGKFLMEWILSHGKLPPQRRRIKEWVTKVLNLERRLRYKGRRELQSSMVMLRQLQCLGDDCALAMQHTEDDPPTFFFLGGGMAAGKTTAVTALTRSDWWRKYGRTTVVVNADEFKVSDPLFSGKGSDIHERSTQAAELLLVNAINQGRDIVFDGTMSWVPFVRQTVEMVRKAQEQTFRCGRGYKPSEGIEEYFVPVGPRPQPLHLPYRIKMIAICVEPSIAVPRAILRQITTGRGVPVGAQLRSFKLFADGFMHYVDMCDEVVLYNNNVWIDLDKGELPLVVAVKEGAGSQLHQVDEHAFQQFMRHSRINIHATGVKDLFLPSSDDFGTPLRQDSSSFSPTPAELNSPVVAGASSNGRSET